MDIKDLFYLPLNVLKTHVILSATKWAWE